MPNTKTHAHHKLKFNAVSIHSPYAVYGFVHVPRRKTTLRERWTGSGCFIWVDLRWSLKDEVKSQGWSHTNNNARANYKRQRLVGGEVNLFRVLNNRLWAKRGYLSADTRLSKTNVSKLDHLNPIHWAWLKRSKQLLCARSTWGASWHDVSTSRALREFLVQVMSNIPV